MIRINFVTLVLLFFCGAAIAQSPREQLNQLVSQLQASPGDTTLRERIIKLAQGIKPSPAVPEDARRAFVQGVTIAKASTDAQGQVLAIESFNEALRIAPWWGDAYYNRAVAQDLAGRLADARDSIRLYLLTGPSAQDARDAQDRIYALEAKEKLVMAAQNTPAVKAAALLSGLEGKQFSRSDIPTGNPNQDIWTHTLEIRGKEIVSGASAIFGNEMRKYNGPVMRWSERGRYKLDGLKFTILVPSATCVANCPAECKSPGGNQGLNCPIYGEIQPDGYSIVLRYPHWNNGQWVSEMYRR